MTSSRNKSAGDAPIASDAGDAGARRSRPRRRVLKSGIVAFNDRFSAVPCAVRNLSASGAHLVVDSTINVPNRFELIVELDGLEAYCEVVWRKDSEIGVRFLSEPRTVAPKRTQVVKVLVPLSVPTLRRSKLRA